MNSLPNDKILAWPKLKAFTDDKPNVARVMISVFDRTENIVGKGENVGYQHFLLFLQGFQRASYTGLLKVEILWERVNLYVTRVFSELSASNVSWGKLIIN